MSRKKHVRQDLNFQIKKQKLAEEKVMEDKEAEHERINEEKRVKISE